MRNQIKRYYDSQLQLFVFYQLNLNCCIGENLYPETSRGCIASELSRAVFILEIVFNRLYIYPLRNVAKYKTGNIT